MTEESSSVSPVSHDQSCKVEIQEQKISLLRHVREGLQTNRGVYFAGEILHSNYGSGWLEAVDIIVAPVKPIYDASKLNKFMDSLIPEIPRSARDEAYKISEGSDFSLGRLYFDETIGTTRKEIKITTTTVEPEALKRAGVSIGESHETKDEQLQRRIWVRVYPDVNSAQLVAEYEQGVKEGTVEPNSTFDYLAHWFSSKQFKDIVKIGGRPFKLPKLLRGRPTD